MNTFYAEHKQSYTENELPLVLGLTASPTEGDTETKVKNKLDKLEVTMRSVVYIPTHESLCTISTPPTLAVFIQS